MERAGSAGGAAEAGASTADASTPDDTTPGGSEERRGLREDIFSASERCSWSVALSFQDPTGLGPSARSAVCRFNSLTRIVPPHRATCRRWSDTASFMTAGASSKARYKRKSEGIDRQGTRVQKFSISKKPIQSSLAGGGIPV